MPPIGPSVIGLCGPAGAGKSTAAAILEDAGYERVRFSGPLKAALSALLCACGLEARTISAMVEGELKELPADILGGKSPRHAMQTLGTEWGRDHISPDFWVGLAQATISAILERGGSVVIEDVRFSNEAEVVRNAAPSAEVWRVEGRGGISGSHPSEGARLAADRVLDNSRSLEALEAEILAAILG